MSESVSLADIERLCWRLSGWTVEQESVDRLLAAVTAYAGGGSAGVVRRDAADDSGWQGARAPLAVLDEAQAATRSPQGAPGAPEEPCAGDSVPGDPSGPEGGVQRLHLTGTLTLVCQGACPPVKPAASKRSKPRARQTPAVDSAVPEATRTCRTCTTVHPITEYPRDSRGLRGRKSVCRECENTRKRESRRAARQRERERGAA